MTERRMTIPLKERLEVWHLKGKESCTYALVVRAQIKVFDRQHLRKKF